MIVVTGHQADLVEQALAGPEGEIRPQSGFRRRARKLGQGRHRGGAGECRRRGGLPRRHAADLDAELIDRLIEAFEPDRGHLIAVPVSDGRRGNPVLWSRRFFRELMTLDGDVGARHLIAKHAEAVAEVPVEGDSAFLDIDTPQALEAARRERRVIDVVPAQRRDDER